MVFNTATVGGAVTPAVVQTFISHYLNRKARAQKPTVHISYDEGINLIRRFLLYASHHTVEDIQRFTSQWVPHPSWVKLDEIVISNEYLTKAAEAIIEQLGHRGVEKVGGKTWWQWRRPGSEMKAEWIEMKNDYNERKKNRDPGRRIMLYVHGGAYFFGSVDEHRYQLQRHARKLKARVFARMLVILRDRSIPLPAGAILISPWVDLTHSFPSVAGDNPLDYIPPHGFHQRPSPSWPPPNTDDMLAIEESVVKKLASKDHASFPQQSEADAVQGFHVDHNPEPGMQNDTAATGTATHDGTGPAANTVPRSGHDLSIMIDGKLVEIKDQIQMYASNQLISHPLVSPILQPSLGGLPPLLILTGGGEMLRDEQIYLAHKAANPAKYPPGDAFLDESPHDHDRNQITRWKPTDVQLQVWDDLCHVAPTLSFTRPAKYMYRSIAQFGAWTLAKAQKTEIDIVDDDDVSIISQSSSDEDDKKAQDEKYATIPTQVGKAGDRLPSFKRHMIRQRVDRHGNISPLEPESELPGCNLNSSEIGVIKEGPVKKWMAAKREWDTKFASAKRRVQKQRAKEYAKGYQQFGDGEVPPPSALAGRRKLGEDLREEKRKRSKGMSLWALWGSKHDEKTIENEQEGDGEVETTVVTAANATPLNEIKISQEQEDRGKKPDYSRSRSRRRIVTDENQTDGGNIDENTPAAELHSRLITERANLGEIGDSGYLTPDFADPPREFSQVLIQKKPTHVDESELKRPKANGIAYPFTLKQPSASASMTTLTSAVGVPPVGDIRTEKTRESGVKYNAADVEAATATGKSAEAVSENPVKTEAPVTENLRAMNEDGERPGIETFFSAQESLPTMGNLNGKAEV